MWSLLFISNPQEGTSEDGRYICNAADPPYPRGPGQPQGRGSHCTYLPGSYPGLEDIAGTSGLASSLPLQATSILGALVSLALYENNRVPTFKLGKEVAKLL